MSDDTPKTLSFHLEKTHNFQTLHADGTFGGLTPNGHAFLAFFVERAPMPKRIDFKIESDGGIGDLCASDGKDGIFREIHTGLTFTKEGLEELKEKVETLLAGMEEDADE